MKAARTCFWAAVLFGCMSLLWWQAQRSSWWSYALFTSAGLILARSEGDIKAAWRKRRHRRKAAS